MNLVWVILCCASFVYCHSTNVSDAHALLKFKDAISSDPQNALATWNLNISVCSWTGIECSSGSGRVVGVDLTGMDLKGSISPSLANISFLQILQLSQNHLGGHIPPELGGLSRLKEIWVYNNQLSGPIPTTLGACRSLELLFVGPNQLQGAIPSQLGLLNRLEFLHLGGNQLTGPIPATLSNCTALQQLFLLDNYLSGSIPPELGEQLGDLQYLVLRTNRMTGHIPKSLGNCSKLVVVGLHENRLSGMVPVELGRLVLLRGLYLQNNYLSGDNAASLSIPLALSNCSSLRLLQLESNNLSGVLPGQLPAGLFYLGLSNNDIRGRIPPHIGNLTNLTYLALDNNSLRDTIPSSLKSFRVLERLNLGNNELQGSIPAEIGLLKHLGLLSLGHNMLSGQIPDSLGELQQLRRLYLHQNRLSGNIPTSLGKCSNLELLDLSGNTLTGNVPPGVAGLPNLQIYFNVSRNMLQGFLPPEIGKMVMVQAIDISANRLSGAIPGTLGSCLGLQYLNLSRNVFQGPTPDSLGQLKSLRDLDLSLNNLSGPLPKFLQNLTMLSHLNLSFNNFTGEIPRNRAFLKFTFASFVGNPRLCGTWIRLPACPAAPVKKRDRHTVLKVAAPTAGACLLIIIISCLLLGFLWRRNRRGNCLAMSKVLETKLRYPRISYEEIFNATNGFSEANLLGTGNFGSVYKAILSDGSIVAAKVIAFQDEAAKKSFVRECKVLGEVRHRNILRIVTFFSNTNNIRGLVLNFMSNGSLEDHLYREEGCRLSLGERLHIAIGIAHGMEYLHHDCSMQVVHCDLKPSNVLLDKSMTPHVADFGIAQLISRNSIDSFTTTHSLRGTIGYIAPEYGLGVRISTKGDVYSYGVVLLEMMTRKRPTSSSFARGLSLREWVSRAFPDRMQEVADSSLQIEQRDTTRNCLIEIMRVGLLCTRFSPEERPTMREVVRLVEMIRQTTQPPERETSMEQLRDKSCATASGIFWKKEKKEIGKFNGKIAHCRHIVSCHAS